MACGLGDVIAMDNEFAQFRPHHVGEAARKAVVGDRVITGVTICSVEQAVGCLADEFRQLLGIIFGYVGDAGLAERVELGVGHGV
jgi:hypothetical protein